MSIRLPLFSSFYYFQHGLFDPRRCQLPEYGFKRRLSVCLSFRMISQKPMQLGSSNLTQMQKCSRTRHWKLQHRRIILFPRVILNFTLDAVSKIWRLINRVRVQYLNEIFRCYQENSRNCSISLALISLGSADVCDLMATSRNGSAFSRIQPLPLCVCSTSSHVAHHWYCVNLRRISTDETQIENCSEMSGF